MDTQNLFARLFPRFFELDAVRSLPEGQVFEELLLPLCEFDPGRYEKPLDEDVSFGFFSGDLNELKRLVEVVDPWWPPYFTDAQRIFCGFVAGKPVSFCILEHNGTLIENGHTLRIGGPGCVGTLPPYRNRGIGLTMVAHATRILRDEGCDYGYIHFTNVAPWYQKLGYRTIVRWTRDGIL